MVKNIVKKQCVSITVRQIKKEKKNKLKFSAKKNQKKKKTKKQNKTKKQKKKNVMTHVPYSSMGSLSSVIERNLG